MIRWGGAFAFLVVIGAGCGLMAYVVYELLRRATAW